MLYVVSYPTDVAINLFYEPWEVVCLEVEWTYGSAKGKKNALKSLTFFFI